MIEKIDFEIRRAGFRAMGRAAGAFMFGCGVTAILGAARDGGLSSLTPEESVLFWLMFSGLTIVGTLALFGALGHVADVMNEYRYPPYDPTGAAEIDGWTRKRQRQVIWSVIALIVGAWVHPLVAVATILVVTVRMAKLELTEAKLRKRVLIQALSRS